MDEAPPLKPVTLRVAGLLGVLVLAGIGALVTLLARDRDERTQLETTSETSAVGDMAWLKHRTRDRAPALSFHGKPLVPPSPRHLELRDTKMTFAGMEDGGLLRLYTTSESAPWEKGEVEIKGQPVYYLKLDSNQYLRVQ